MKYDDLSELDAEALLILIDTNIEEGWYYGNKEYYFKRLNRIKKNIEATLDKQKTNGGENNE